MIKKGKIEELVKIICAGEGKKVQVSVGNVREVLSVMKKLSADPSHYKLISEYLLK